MYRSCFKAHLATNYSRGFMPTAQAESLHSKGSRSSERTLWGTDVFNMISLNRITKDFQDLIGSVDSNLDLEVLDNSLPNHPKQGDFSFHQWRLEYIALRSSEMIMKEFCLFWATRTN